MKYAELALKLTPEEDHFGRAQATVLLGFTYWVSGNLDAASTFALADIMVAQGRLREAERDIYSHCSLHQSKTIMYNG